MPKRYPPQIWNEIRTAHAAGGGLREMARHFGIPEGTVLFRAMKEGWSEQIRKAREAATQSKQIIPGEKTAQVLGTLAQKSRIALAKGLHKGAEHVESMTGAAIIEKAPQIASLTRASGQVFAWQDSAPPTLRLDVIAGMRGNEIGIAASVSLDAPSVEQDDEL